MRFVHTMKVKNNATARTCPFCRLIREERIVAEHGTMLAIEDGYPVTDGHLLLVPRRHTADCFTMTRQEAEDARRLIRFLARQIREGDPSVNGFNIGTNSGASAGQTVFHAHIHLIPRRDGDCDHPRGGVRGVIDGKRSY